MKLNYQKLYENLGYLFYAIAAADQHVHREEIDKLKILVGKEWLPLENSTDSYGTDAAHYISIAFEYLLSEGMSSEDAYKVFSDFYDESEAGFSKDLKRKIKSTATAIAGAFGGKNKKEQLLIGELNRLMK
jgi:hypothetical protein